MLEKSPKPQTSPRARRRESVVLPLVLIVGAGLAGVGAFLEWLRMSGGTIGIPGGSVPGALSGYELDPGLIAVVAAGVAALCGILWFALGRSNPVVAIVSVIAGAAVAIACAYVFLDPTQVFVENAAKLAGNEETTTADLTSLLPRFFAANDVAVTVEMGLFVTSAGAALTIIGGVAALVAARRSSR